MRKQTKKKKVVIMGGGLAGLSCADELLRKAGDRFAVTVLEKNAFLGGLAATFKKDGFYFDLAPHRWFTKNEELNRWINQLMGDQLIWVDKNTPMYQYGKFFSYPIKFSDVLRKVGPVKSFLMLITFLWAKLMRRKIVTMKDAYIDRFGYLLFKWFNEEYNDKLWGANACEEMSADFVEQRVKNLSLLTAIKNALGLDSKVVSLTPRFRFPKKGIGQISDRLAKRIRANGGRIKTKTIIKAIKTEKHRIKIVTNKGVFTAHELISSIPLDELVNLLRPQPPRLIRHAAQNLAYVHQKIVVLLADRPRLTRFTWVYVHPPQIRFFRFLETSNWSAAMSPTGKTSLVFEYPYQEQDDLGRVEDKKLIQKTINDFVHYFSPQTSQKVFLKGLVFSVPKAYPKYDLHYKQHAKKIKNYLSKNFPHLQLIGRNGMFRYNNMDHSVLTGLLAARNLVAGKKLYDPEKVNSEATYLEEKEAN